MSQSLGYGLNEGFRGRYRSAESQLFMGYGLSDRLVFEFEAGFIHATFDKAPNDISATPARIEESGLADFEGQFRLRLVNENDRHPEVFSYLKNEHIQNIVASRADVSLLTLQAFCGGSIACSN